MNKAIYLDMDLCSGCGACAVACMDQHDIDPEKGQPGLKRIYQIERGEFPNAQIHHVAASCMHCQDSPCLVACPTGAISRDNQTGAIMVNRELCIGCRSCAQACPFGVPRYDNDGKMHKCDLCKERVEAGLEPACVRVCPVEALKFDYPNKVQGEREFKLVEKIVNAVIYAASSK
ncbi:MAG: 4Fe-4S dicluster domain-containing protein [Deltaproteobacteria bacterium]|nr:4Fe-4S dicluster domain-containing protein [Deltaproteobacteria bacterium]